MVRFTFGGDGDGDGDDDDDGGGGGGGGDDEYANDCAIVNTVRIIHQSTRLMSSK